MGYITRLNAINEMLLAAGESLVADIDESSGIDTEIAEFILDNVTSEFQLRGIAGNKYIRKMKPDTNKRLMLPADCLSVRLVSYHVSNDKAGGYDGFVIESGIRGEPNGYLYNVTEQTEFWETGTEYTLELVQNIRWEDMDTAVQRGILSSAARWYQMMTQGDDTADQYLAGKEAFNLAKGRAAEVRQRGRNILDSSDIGRRSIRRGNSTYNDPTRFRFWNHRM
jgi:hypothetical protein